MKSVKFLILAVVACVVCGSQAAQAMIYNDDYEIMHGKIKSGKRVDMVYGVMAGVTLPKMGEKSDQVDINNTAGYEIGMMWGVDLGGFEIVPELWYMHENTTIGVPSRGESYDLKLSSIEVPILFQVPVGNVLRFNIGPTFSLMSDSKLSGEGIEEIDFGRTKSTTGYVIGVSATFAEHYVVDFRYTGRYKSYNKPWYDGSESHDYRVYNFGLNIGYKF